VESSIPDIHPDFPNYCNFKKIYCPSPKPAFHFILTTPSSLKYSINGKCHRNGTLYKLRDEKHEKYLLPNHINPCSIQ